MPCPPAHHSRPQPRADAGRESLRHELRALPLPALVEQLVRLRAVDPHGPLGALAGPRLLLAAAELARRLREPAA